MNDFLERLRAQMMAGAWQALILSSRGSTEGRVLMTVQQMREKRVQLIQQAREIMDRVDGECRPMTDEEGREFERLHDEADDLKRKIDAAVTRAQRQQASEDHLNQLQGSAADRSRLLNASLHMGGGERRQRPGATDLLVNAANNRPVEVFEHDQPICDQPMDVGRILHAHMTGRTDMLSPAEVMALGSKDSDGGYLLGTSLSGTIVDLARSASVVMRAGARTVRLTGAELAILGVASDPTSQWRHEGVAVTASSMTFGKITLRPKTLACIIPVPIEWLEDAMNGGQIITQAIRSSMGLMLDQAALLGTGAEAQPRGLQNNDGLNQIVSVGTPADYSDLTAAVGDVLAANYPQDADGLAWVANPRDLETYDGLQDTTNQPMMPTPWASKLMRLSTTSIPTNLGGGGNESISFVGDFMQVVVGMRTTGVNIRVLESGTAIDSLGVTHNAASELKKLIVAYLRADVGVLRPSWLTMLSGITNT